MAIIKLAILHEKKREKFVGFMEMFVLWEC